MLGTTLDRASPKKRWDRWRPTVDLFRHEDLLIHRLELIHGTNAEELALQIRDDIQTVSPETTVHLHTIDFVNPWDFEEVYGRLYEFTKGYTFKPSREDYLVHMTTGTHVAQICWFLLTESRHVPGRLVQTAPPKAKSEPVGTYSIIDLDLSRYDKIAERFERERLEGVSFLKSGIKTQNSAFNRLIERIEKVAIRSRAPIFITGPTGAGKSQLARRIYELKKARRQIDHEFVEVNCATLRGDAAMSTLFGHKKGSFTGALSDRPGLLKSADKGLLFLDEIGELGLDEQAMLLRALEERRFLPVGADKETESDFQLIAGTNRDLRRRVVEGQFREDLLARIDLWSFELPGLAERPEDIEPNLAYELERFARTSGQRITFNAEAKKRFLTFARASSSPWRGNFRDFNAAVTRMGTLATGGRINVQVVDEELDRLRESWRRPDGTAEKSSADPLKNFLSDEDIAQLDRFDRVQLADVVEVCLKSKSLSAAGRVLFSESRKKKNNPNDADRLRKYLARFHLSWDLIHGDSD